MTCMTPPGAMQIFDSESKTTQSRCLVLKVFFFFCVHRLVGLVVKASASACTVIFPGRVIPVTSKLALQWLPCQAPGVKGSVLGLVGQVSV